MIGLAQAEKLARALPHFDSTAFRDGFGMTARGMIVGEIIIGRGVDVAIGPEPIEAVTDHGASRIMESGLNEDLESLSLR